MNPRFLTLTLALVATWVAAGPVKSAESIPPRPAIVGIAQVAFYARDLATSRNYYRDFLGYAERPAEHAAMAGRPLTWFEIKRQVNCYDPDGTRTELMEPGTHDGRPVPPSTAPLPTGRR